METVLKKCMQVLVLSKVCDLANALCLVHLSLRNRFECSFSLVC